MSSSFAENLTWVQDHAFDSFDWDDWLKCAEGVIPVPVYDLARILDSAAAWDIMYHARHWPYERAHEIGYVRVPSQFGAVLRSAGVDAVHQQQYAARAMYCHCDRYVIGIGVTRDVPTDHMAEVPAVPYRALSAVIDAAQLGPDQRKIECWLDNVICRNMYRATVLHSKPIVTRQAPGRRRGRTRTQETTHPDGMQSLVNQRLHEIRDIAPQHLPNMWCTVTPASGSRMAIALFARPPAPCDE